MKETFLQKLEVSGLISTSAKQVGITSNLVNAERKVDPEFDKACEEAMALFNESLEEEMIRRARDGVEIPVYNKDGELVGHQTKYSDKLLEFALKNRDEKYNDKLKTEVNFSGGVLLAAPIPMSPQSWFQQQREAAQLPPPQNEEEVIDVVPADNRETVESDA